MCRQIVLLPGLGVPTISRTTTMSSTSQSFKLKASQKARFDGEVDFGWPHWCISIGKWLFTIVLSLLIFVGAVANRMTLPLIATSDPNINMYNYKEFRFLTLVVILMVPYGVEFLRYSWLHGFVRGHPWPSWIGIASGIAVSIIEVFGVCYFTIAVATNDEMSSAEIILFTNGVFILPALKNFFNPRERGSVLTIIALATVLFDLGGLAWAIYKFSSTKVRTALPASLVLLNIAWFSPLRKWQTRATTEPGEAAYGPVLINRAPQSSSTDLLTEFDNVLISPPRAGSATLKSGVLNSALKLTIVPFVSAFFCHFYNVAHLSSVSADDIGPSMGVYWNCLWVNIFCSLAVYLMGVFACSIGVQRQAFAIPLLFVTPVCLFISSVHWACNTYTIRYVCAEVTGGHHYHVLIIAALLWIGLVVYVTVYIWKPQKKALASEKDLFLIPYSYSGVFLEQYMLLNREDTFDDRPCITTVYPPSQAKVFLCTTMYREDPEIMEQYLHCLLRVYDVRRMYNSIETHVVFDDAFATKRELNEHAQTFINLCRDIILKDGDASISQAVRMPYGSQVVITLKDGMTVYLHFKDTLKVKKGKRWSQMMIMSWVIDTQMDSLSDPANAYFVTCDADVSFTNSSIERLLAVMVRKPDVGGTTCRVHADGSGPVVWYQMFEYSIWHWLVKAANNVIGSVTCCSGFFSMFRLNALADVLPIFSRPTESGADYIRKDLGEDRWLSCLLLKSGWLLDYCSLAEVSTSCPESFDTFFQQRRHWIVSSFANTCSLIKDFRKVRHFNNKLSAFFFAYLIATVFFMVVSPAVMIWMITGTIYYIAGSAVLLLVIGIPFLGLMLVYIAACLFTLGDFHRALAKAGSYILSVLVFILTIVAIMRAIRFHKETVPRYINDAPYKLDKEMEISVSLLYLIIYGGVFVITALVHARESYCCLQSLWYLLCLPGFNIFLVTYSVCNIHKKNSELEAPDDNCGWYLRFLKYICRKKEQTPHTVNTFCCSCCANATDAVLSEAIDVNTLKTSNKCEGVEVGDIPDQSDEEDPMEESTEEGEDIVDVGISEQRQYWKQLQDYLLPYDELALADRLQQLCHIRNGGLLVFSLANILWFIVDYGAVLANPLGFASLTLFTAIVLISSLLCCIID